MSWKIPGCEEFFRRVYSFIRDLRVVTKVYEKRHEAYMSGLFWKMTKTPCDTNSYWVFTHLYIVHLAAPWRRMPVVLKEDLGLSSLGLTGSRGMLQYGVAFMKIISRRSNDRLFDNPIRGETRDIHIKCSKQFKWNLYFYLSGQSRPFWAALKLL